MQAAARVPSASSYAPPHDDNWSEAATVEAPHAGSSDPFPADITHYIEEVQCTGKVPRAISSREFELDYKVFLRISPGAQGSLRGALVRVWRLDIPAKLRASARTSQEFVAKIQDELPEHERYSHYVEILKSHITGADGTWDEYTVMRMVAGLVANAIDEFEEQRAASSRNRPPQRRDRSRSRFPGSLLGSIAEFLSSERR